MKVNNQSSMKAIILLNLAFTALCQNSPLCANPPAKGTDPTQGGLFGRKFNPDSPPAGDPPMSGKWKFLCNGTGLLAPGPESPPSGMPHLNRSGSGMYKSGPEGRAEPSLPKHLIYAPLNPPPADVKMPVLVFGEGGCINMGNMFPDLQAEIASHGYLVIANGKADPVGPAAITSAMTATTTAQMLTDSVDWVLKGNAAKYGNIDTEHIAAIGQSCGGLEAYSASYHDDRIKMTILLNSGIFVADSPKKCLLKELKAPVAMFLGGPCDGANINGITDYDLLTVPKFKMHLDTGHMGTYWSTNGGKFAKALVAFLDWRFKGDEKAKLRFSDPKSENSFVKDNWYNITSSWFPHYESKSPYFNDTLV